MGKPTIKYYKWQFSIAMLNYQRLLTVALHLCKDMLKTTAKAVQKKALLGWTVPILTGRRAKMTHRHSLQPLFFGLAKQKNFISTAGNARKKEHHVIATKKEPEDRIQVCRNLTFDALSTREVFYKCQRRHARFPVGRDVLGINGQCSIKGYNTIYRVNTIKSIGDSVQVWPV